MNDIQAQALIDQIETAYYDQSPEADMLFEVLLERAIDLLSNEQYAALNQRLVHHQKQQVHSSRHRPTHTHRHTHTRACTHTCINTIRLWRRAQ